MLLQKTSGTDVFFVSSQNMSSRLVNTAQFTLWTRNFVNHVTFERICHRSVMIRHLSLSFDVVDILGLARGEKLLTLEALFISEIKPTLNTKNQFRSRELKLKF